MGNDHCDRIMYEQGFEILFLLAQLLLRTPPFSNVLQASLIVQHVALFVFYRSSCVVEPDDCAIVTADMRLKVAHDPLPFH